MGSALVTRFTNALVKSRPIWGLGGEQVSVVCLDLGRPGVDIRMPSVAFARSSIVQGFAS